MSLEFKKKLINKFRKNPNLCNWLQYYSVEVWNRIGFTRQSKNGRISETTITENLVYEFWKLAAAARFAVQIYESKNERVNGNDLEIFIETNRGFLFIPCQAKILYENDKYMAISHKVGQAEQIQLLIDFANRKGGIPFYLLYNFSLDNVARKYFFEMEKSDISLYGCSMIGADFINRYYRYGKVNSDGKNDWLIPRFHNLNPIPAFPFHSLICSLQTSNVDEWMASKKMTIGTIEPRFYNKQELDSDDNWKDLAPLPRIGYITNDENNFLSDDKRILEANIDFNPQYRVIFPKEKRKNILVRYLG
jgi:hypothetical protein